MHAFRLRVDTTPHLLALPEAGLRPPVLVLQQPLLPQRLRHHGIQLDACLGGASCSASLGGAQSRC